MPPAVPVGDPASVGRHPHPHPVPWSPVGGQCFACAETVGGKAPDLLLPFGIHEGVDPLAVGARHGLPGAAGCRKGKLDAPELPGPHHHRAPPGGQRHPVAPGAEAHRGQPVHGVIDPAGAGPGSVRPQVDGDGPVLSRRQVVKAEVGAVLVDHPAAVGGQRGPADFEVCVPGELRGPAPVRIHAPEVRHAVGVAHHVERPVPPHGAREVPRMVGGQAHRLLVHPRAEAPELGHGAPPVGPHIVGGHVQTEASEVQGAIGIEGPLPGIGQGEVLHPPGHRVHGPEHPGPAGPHPPLAGVEDATVGGPPLHPDLVGFVGQPFHRPPARRHAKHVGAAIISPGEGQPRPVGGEAGFGLGRRMAREAPGGAPRDRHAPQIRLRREDQGLAVERGGLVVAREGFGGGLELGGHGRCRQNDQAPGQQEGGQGGGATDGLHGRRRRG